MDSLTQMALGATVSAAVMGRRVPLRHALLWGAVCGTLPDLDVLIRHGDPVSDMVLHRSESHSLFWLSLAAPWLAALICALHRDRPRFGRWCLAVWLALITHPLLDAMTVYGTRLTLPFDDTPWGVGSVFIIDPLYTLPLLAGLLWAVRHPSRVVQASLWGLGVSSVYLAWSVVAQQHITRQVEAHLQASGLPQARILVTPTPFNTLWWRIVVLDDDTWYEGYTSVLRPRQSPSLIAYPRGTAFVEKLSEHPPIAALTAFSQGYVDFIVEGEHLQIRDLRMGQAPHFFFSFIIARQDGSDWVPVPAERAGSHPPLREGLAELRQRLRTD